MSAKRFLSMRQWRRRLVFWLGAIAVGAVSVLFAELSNWAQATFQSAYQYAWWLPLIITPAGFVVCCYLARTTFDGAQGSGIPQVIAARSFRSTAAREALLSPKLMIGKIGLTIIGLLSGASIGREGPTVQIGAAIMLKIAAWGGLRHARGIILAGSAAGISAAFNTPLAGIVFAIEELSQSFEHRTTGLVLYAVIIAGLVSRALVGNYTYFGTMQGAVSAWADWRMVIACGVVGGLAGGGFSRAMLVFARRIKRLPAIMPGHLPALGIALAGGLIVAVLGIATGGATFGTGYEQARAAVEGQSLSGLFWPTKLAATLIAACSGIPGGIFAPSLAVGAGLGAWLGGLLGASSSSLACVLGMAGYFSGVVQAPLTAFVIILEMTGSTANVIPLMIAAALGYGISSLITTPLYRGLAEGFIKSVGEAHPHGTPGAKP
jgi:H+/Cl- antiporter ClcA